MERPAGWKLNWKSDKFFHMESSFLSWENWDFSLFIIWVDIKLGLELKFFNQKFCHNMNECRISFSTDHGDVNFAINRPQCAMSKKRPNFHDNIQNSPNPSILINDSAGFDRIRSEFHEYLTSIRQSVQLKSTYISHICMQNMKEMRQNHFITEI